VGSREEFGGSGSLFLVGTCPGSPVLWVGSFTIKVGDLRTKLGLEI